MLDFSRENSNIGERNIEAAEEKLDELDIPIVGKDVGKDYGRSVFFDTETNELKIKSAKKEDKTI